jgi:hypothetical protein
MTTNTQNVPEEPTWGAEPPAPSSGPTWSTKKTIAAVAIAVGIAAAGGTAIYAASGTAAPEAGGGPRGLYGFGGPGGRGTTGGFGTATHGQFQVGEVTEVSASSISVKSTDGFTQTYTIDAKTVIGATTPDQQKADISSIAKGDTVTVVAESGTTAASISERPAGMGQGMPGQNGQQQGVIPRRDQQQGTPPTT